MTVVFLKHDETKLSDVSQDKINKGKRYDSYGYVMDSTNLAHFTSLDAGLPDVVLERVRE